MKRFINLIVLAFIAWSCKPNAHDQNDLNEPESSDYLLELSSLINVEGLAAGELETVVKEGESDKWKKVEDSGNTTIIKNKLNPDYSVRFVLYHGDANSVVCVQQQNANDISVETWRYQSDHEEWSKYPLREFTMEDFFDERVALPTEFNGSAKPYLSYEFGSSSIVVSLDKWQFMHEIEGKTNAPDPTLIKYKYVLNWNGNDFVEKKMNEAGYNDLLTFTSSIVEQQPDGPGIHEFDCPHGVSVKTSSTLNKQGKYTYDASNMLTPQTAWSEGVEGEGIGEWIEFTITSDYYIGDRWQIANGNNHSKESWQANNRIKKLKVLIDDKVVGDVMLSNLPAFQEFSISPGWLKERPVFKKGTRIKFIIEEVYKGSKYNDTLISYLVPVGNCG